MARVPGAIRERRGRAAAERRGSLRGGAAPEPGLRTAEGSGLCYPRPFPDTAVLVLLVAGCELRCVFCRSPQPQAGVRPPTAAEALALVRQAHPRRRLLITGGEPTARDDLLALCAEARRAGFAEVQIQTHGGRLADAAFTGALVRAGATGVDLPLYAAAAEVHDRVTGVAGSQARALAGAATARAGGLDVAVHTTLFADTLDQLPGVLRLAASCGGRRISAEPVALIDDLAAYAAETPRLGPLGDAVAAALDGAGRGDRAALTFASIPPCALPARTRRRRPRLGRPRPVPRRGAIPLGYSEVLAAITDGASRAYGSACSPCRLRRSCAGVPAEYLRAFGEGALPARDLTGGPARLTRSRTRAPGRRP
ncbi:MAG: radical SAM protein [Deltaproteobacteria bacterium]|nr:radical SAM protein [Deltaproteobacteria bacterium]